MTRRSALMAGLVMASLVSVVPATVDAQALERSAEYTPGRPTGLQGPYLGQTVPGIEPQVFAPGLVSVSETGDYAPAFSPDGKELYFTRSSQDRRSQTIMVSRLGKDGWTTPEPFSPSAGFSAHEPHVSLDGKRLYWGWMRPLPEGEPNLQKMDYGIWASDRMPDGWSAPVFVGQGMFVTSSRAGTVYVTDHTELPNGYLARVRMTAGKFGGFERLTGGMERLRSAQPTNIAHPGIAPDESYVLFDFGGRHLHVCFRNADGTWGDAIDLALHGIPADSGIASVSPDGKFIFFGYKRDVYWVSARLIEGLRPKGNGPANSDEAKVQSQVLPNGLATMVQERPGSGKFDAVMSCLAGYAFDPPGASGTAHLVEHYLAAPMIALMSPPREWIEERSKAFEKPGAVSPERIRQLEAQISSWKTDGHWSVSTSADVVNYGVQEYGATSLARFFRAAAEVLRLVPTTNFEAVRGGLVRELEQLDRDRRSTLVSSNAIAAYGEHPYGVPSGGRVQDVNRLTIESLQRFVASYYSPHRCAVAVVGDVKADEVQRAAGQFLAEIPKKPEPPSIAWPARTPGERRASIRSIAGPRLLINFRKPPMPSRDDDVAEVIAALLSGDGAWGVREEFVLRRKMGSEAWCTNGGSGQLADNLLTVGLTPVDGASLETAESALIAHLDRLASEAVADAEIKAAIQRLLDTPVGGGSGLGTAIWLARVQATTGDWRGLWRARESRSRVTAADIRAFARQYLSPGNRTVVRLLPETK